MMIYFIQRSDGGQMKIGRSVDPAGRLRALQTGHPERLTILAVAPGDAELETDLHSRLNAYRVSNEWFHAAPEVLAVIRELQANTA